MRPSWVDTGGVGTPDDVSIHMAVLLIRQQSMYYII